MRLELALLVLTATASVASAQQTWYVDASAAAPGDGSAQAPYSSIQFAIDAPQTTSGHTLLLAPGIYTEHLRFYGKSLALVGAGGPFVTFLQGNGANTSLIQWVDGEGPGTRIEGLTLRNNFLGQGTAGGAGLLCWSSEGEVVNCRFLNLSTTGGPGGGIQAFGFPRFRVVDSLFQGCGASPEWGGGMISGGALLELERCSFLGCWAGGFGGARGGGLSHGGGSAIVRDCVFAGCSADTAGGFYATGTHLNMTGCTVSGCSADGGTGGLMLWNSQALISDCLFRNNTMGTTGVGYGTALYSNSLGATHVARSRFVSNGSPFTVTLSIIEGATLERCSIVGNSCYEWGNSPVVANSVLNSCIVWDNLPAIAPLTSSAATFSLIEYGFPGVGNLSAPPMFVNQAGGDLRLLPGSPAIDAGDPTLSLDSDGTRADMGASPWVAQIERYCVAKTSSIGCVPTVHWSGRPSFLTNDFQLGASDVINNRVGLMFWGLGATTTPFLGGTLCVATSARTPLHSSGGNALGTDCSGSWSFDFDASYMTARGLSPDDIVFAQFWGRDPGFAPPNSVMLSDAVRFVVEH